MMVDDAPAVGRLRVPPHSAEAEQSVLGALLNDNAAYAKVCDVVTDAGFYRSENRLIFAAIAGLILADKPAEHMLTQGNYGNLASFMEIGG